MAVKIICGYDDDDYTDYEWLFKKGYFDQDDWDYIIDGGVFWETTDFDKIETLASKLEVYDSIIKEIHGKIYAVTYHS